MGSQTGGGLAKGEGGRAMSQLDDFKSKFDEEGRFRNRDGTQSVCVCDERGRPVPG